MQLKCTKLDAPTAIVQRDAALRLASQFVCRQVLLTCFRSLPFRLAVIGVFAKVYDANQAKGA